MASIVLNNLKNTRKSERGYTYSDLHLDIEDVNLRIAPDGTSINGRDIKSDYDVDAIINSLFNLFNTSPGERFLVPTFGTNLKAYLFEPITDMTANKIGNEIVRAIEKWEPRVTIKVVKVVGIPDQHQYDVTISLIINFIKKAISLSGNIDVNEYQIFGNIKRVA